MIGKFSNYIVSCWGFIPIFPLNYRGIIAKNIKSKIYLIHALDL